MTLTLISGLVCFATSFLMLYILSRGFDNKHRLLKAFQFLYFVILFLFGGLQTGTYYIAVYGGKIPHLFGTTYNATYLLVSVVAIVYYMYYTTKTKSKTQ